MISLVSILMVAPPFDFSAATAPTLPGPIWTPDGRPLTWEAPA